jgi:hypothetical protein
MKPTLELEPQLKLLLLLQLLLEQELAALVAVQV